MNNPGQMDFVLAERRRIQIEYERRQRDVSPDRYAAWQPASRFMIEERRRKALAMLREAKIVLTDSSPCLEVGVGTHGWLSELSAWGVQESNLNGIDLDPARVLKARELFPQADLRIGDAVELPWHAERFSLVIASTLFTSILDGKVRKLIASEIERVLAPGGALVFYDFCFDNPRNPNVRGIGRSELRNLFPKLSGRIRSVTLAPPLTRLLAPRSLRLATLLSGIPLLRTHLLAVLIKSDHQ